MIGIGVHCSVRRGFLGALEEASHLGCEALQMFTQNPRGWRTRSYHEEEFSAFRTKRAELGMGPIVVHSPYLPNLCTSSLELYEKSTRSLWGDLERCERLGAEYLVIHPGAYSPEATPQFGIERLITSLNDVLSNVPGQSMILVENMAGGGRRLGSRFEELGEILRGVKAINRIGICFDTCHALAAGYDLRQKRGIERTLTEFDQYIGLNNLRVIHANDSKGSLGCHRDRHEHIGRGAIGRSGFRALLGQGVFQTRTFILETPKDSPEADRRNMRTLRSFFP